MLAKPNLRGAEGQKLSLNLGEDVPVPSTTFTPLAGGGSNVNPLTSYGYRTIGIIVDMTPRVTYDGDIILEITIENSARGQDSNIAGQNLPSFFSRKVPTKLRLRDGESNLLAGLLREDERSALTGFPGIMRLPIVKQLFSDNDNTIKQTDIVMLLTPRIVRTHELRASDLSPIYIGTQSNMALTGPPVTIGGAAEPDPPPAAARPPCRRCRRRTRAAGRRAARPVAAPTSMARSRREAGAADRKRATARRAAELADPGHGDPPPTAPVPPRATSGILAAARGAGATGTPRARAPAPAPAQPRRPQRSPESR